MDTYNKYYGNNKKVLKKSIVNYITKILLSIIFFLLSLIYISTSSDNKDNFNRLVFSDSISFAKINDFYQKHFGSIVPIEDVTEENTKKVFNETLEYETIEPFLDGKMLIVKNNYMVPILQSGVVVYLGDKQNYGNTVIVQGVDGVDIWYSNIDTTSLNLYDYLNKGTLIGPVVDNKLYLVLMKDNNYISYEDYKV